MADVPVFADAATVLCTRLRAALTGIGETATVHANVPDPRPSRFVHLHRVGGPRRDPVTDAPLMAFDAWAQTDSDAALLAEKVRSLVGSMRGGSPAIHRTAEASGPIPLPDPESTQPRYTFTAEIAVRFPT